jgi:type VI secretion system secreted protein Hcp
MAQEDYFLKIDGVKGESQDDKHKDEIHVSSFSFGVTNSGTGGSNLGSGGGRSNNQDLHVTKVTDASSPNLFIACATGKHFPNATVTVRRAGEKPQEYLVYKLTEVYISSHTTSGHEGGGIAQESVSLNFSKVEMAYTPQNADGSPGAKNTKTYDVKANKSS